MKPPLGRDSSVIMGTNLGDLDALESMMDGAQLQGPPLAGQPRRAAFGQGRPRKSETARAVSWGEEPEPKSEPEPESVPPENDEAVAPQPRKRMVRMDTQCDLLGASPAAAKNSADLGWNRSYTLSTFIKPSDLQHVIHQRIVLTRFLYVRKIPPQARMRASVATPSPRQPSPRPTLPRTGWGQVFGGCSAPLGRARAHIFGTESIRFSEL